ERVPTADAIDGVAVLKCAVGAIGKDSAVERVGGAVAVDRFPGCRREVRHPAAATAATATAVADGLVEERREGHRTAATHHHLLDATYARRGRPVSDRIGAVVILGGREVLQVAVQP